MFSKNIHIIRFFGAVSLGLMCFGFVQDTYADCFYDGENFHVGDDVGEVITPIYRLYNQKVGAHLYARGTNDANKILQKWRDFRYDDVTPAFCMSLSQQEGLTPIYRLYNKRTKIHLYTRGEVDRDKVLSKWHDFEFTDGGPAFWADLTSDAGSELYHYQGPNITIGLHAYPKNVLKDTSFKLDAQRDYIIKDKNNSIIANVQAGEQTKVKYDSDGNLIIYNSIDDIIVDNEVIFEAADSIDSTMIFDIHKPESSFDEYRGKIKLRYDADSKMIWVINELPLEQYIWGMGEITGTGPMEYNKVMTTAYRTYGYWKILYSTKYAREGFKVNATPGNQLYYGYEWEQSHPRIREGAEATRGKIVKHEDDVALTPYSSWTDGHTRSFEERWGSTLYPWCQSVNDSYGEHPTKSTQELFATGNHMVGISAHGALNLASEHEWNWEQIMKYYLTDVTITSIY